MKEELELISTETEIVEATPIEETPSNIVEFDLDRLVREIDQTFQEKDKEHMSKYLTELNKKSADKLTDFEKFLVNKLREHEASYAQIVRNYKQELLDEISRGRTLITISGTNQEIGVGHMDHPKMEDVIKTLVLNKRAMLVGPAGTGKTTIASQIAEKMRLPFYKYSCSRDSSVFDLLGYKQPTSEQYLETSFLKCYENGGIFLVDEYDAMSGDMSLFFNGVADASKFLSVPHRDAKPQAVKHKDFHIVMCGNTWGKGSHEFTGRDFQDAALMDRFRYSRHHIGYHHELEKRLMGSHYAFADQLRKTLESMGSYLSTRNIEDIAIAIGSGVSKKDIITMSSADLNETDKKNILDKMRNYA